ncbi:hypothetical protein RUM43_012284 [Polyplax serrata]|uniref:Uncharacterized protein n=1 Tax=Polyplax serrata TaxID=468196 RepID=A0AAN8S082_POLSC
MGNGSERSRKNDLVVCVSSGIPGGRLTQRQNHGFWGYFCSQTGATALLHSTGWIQLLYQAQCHNTSDADHNPCTLRLLPPSHYTPPENFYYPLTIIFVSPPLHLYHFTRQLLPPDCHISTFLQSASTSPLHVHTLIPSRLIHTFK